MEIPGTSYSDSSVRYSYRLDEQENLWQYFFVIMRRLHNAIDLPFQMDSEGFGREDQPQLGALREALVNMLMHADYFSPMKSRIRIFNNRIEFLNAGALPQDLEMIRSGDMSLPRNPILAKLFRIVNLAENAGYGFDKMEEGWKPYAGTAPVFEQGTNFTKVDFWLSAEGTKGGQKGGQTEPLTSRQEEVFSMLKNRNTMGRKEIFMRYADRTLIFRCAVPLADAPENLFIISKKGDSVSLFTYHYYQGDIPRYPEPPDSLAAYITKEKHTRDGIAIDPFFEVLLKNKAKNYGTFNSFMFSFCCFFLKKGNKKFYRFVTFIQKKVTMKSVSKTIEERINRRRKSGELIFPADFRGSGTEAAIKMALSRLSKEGVIKRIGHGIYVVPKQDKIFGDVLPGPQEVAESIAKKDKVRIMPSGATAMHKLGLTSQVPMKLIYLTDGPARQIKLGNTTIRFKSTTPKKFAMKGKYSSLIIQALDEIGVENIDSHNANKIKQLLKEENKEALKHDLRLAPAKINDYLIKLINNKL